MATTYTTTTARDITPGSILIGTRGYYDVAEVRIETAPWEAADATPRARVFDLTGRAVATYAPDEAVRVILPAAPVTIIR